jgi:anti-sigma regulatory factor (Ser/Thr protein kinase)
MALREQLAQGRNGYVTSSVLSDSAGFVERRQTIPADIARLREARAFADEAAAECGFADDVRYQIKLVMSEAVANAIQHGSSSTTDPIDITAVTEEGALVFYVADTGSFVPRIEPRGELPERGRGLEFMGQLMDDVDVRPGRDGTVLRFAKRLG